MLEAVSWVEKNFNEAPDAIFIFRDDQLLISNHAAHALQADYGLRPAYIIKLMQNVVKQRQSQTDDCFNCTVLDQAKTRVVLVCNI